MGWIAALGANVRSLCLVPMTPSISNSVLWVLNSTIKTYFGAGLSLRVWACYRNRRSMYHRVWRHAGSSDPYREPSFEMCKFTRPRNARRDPTPQGSRYANSTYLRGLKSVQ